MIEFDALTKEVIELGFTPKELEQRDRDANIFSVADKIKIEEEKAKTTSKSSALAKLTILGLTEDEVYAIMES